MEAFDLWEDDELRSLNGQIEYLLRLALRRAGRLRSAGSTGKSRMDAKRS